MMSMLMPKPPPVASLRALLADFAEVSDGQDRPITGLSLDSRQVRPGDLFFAYQGERNHGGAFLSEAVAKGATAVVFDRVGFDTYAHTAGELAVVGVDGLERHVGEIAARFFERPSETVAVIGVTGTNGKTSCSHFLAQLLSDDGQRCGVMGTIGNGFPGALVPSTHTTPDPIRVQSLLAEMRDVGATRVVMEVSSHGLDQGRVSGVAFHTALLTNLSRDHLDFHGDMAAYAAAKRRLFLWPGLKYAVLNLDDEFGQTLCAEIKASGKVIGYTLEGRAMDVPTVRASGIDLHASGIRLQVETPWGEGELESGLLGRFNASNLLGVLAAALSLEVPFDGALKRLREVLPPPGRLERFGGAGRPLAVVDYAHTPDALAQALSTLRAHCDGTLWCVFGCGGDRDRGKRPEMAAVAERLADRVVVTDDNPRREDPDAIIKDILAGLQDPAAALVERDREAAIALAVSRARPGDIVLVAGKGHEDYQIVGDERRHFSDRAVVTAAVEGWS